ncbi:hypothetical protein M8013_10870 [Enterobacteriaceae bacterium H4N4]|uniref:Uncharacterized protein n=1 Tax=Silvania confinis TaxID=2926470 RepID=A0A9J6QIX7_9ENTR|nr:hypothetical protein [Silvania confinis]MCU6669250.1 hypothetical protein [Silvania confinis]
MMKMNKLTARWMLTGIAIITPVLAAGYIHHQRDDFSCESRVTVVDKHDYVDVLVSFSFHDGKGLYQASGEDNKPNQPPVAVSNNVMFDYWREDGRMIMVSSETNELPKVTLPFRVNIPDFFRHRERGLRMQVVPANSSSYYFIYNNSPVFYCSKG